MKSYPIESIRTFAIIGQPTSGKTMLAEAMLLCGGVITRLGSIAAGSTVSDYHPAEKTRQISIYATPLFVEWAGTKFNIIDAPGYLDFVAEALSALRVSDLAVVVAHPIDGLGVATDRPLQYADELGLPKILVINMLDREHVKPDEILEQLRKRFGSKVCPITYPVNAGPGFNQLVDILRLRLLTYATDGSGSFTESELKGSVAERAEELRQQLVETVAESDDTLLEKFFEQEGLSEEEMRGGIRAALLSGSLIPVFCTAAEKNIGVNRLMDFIAMYGPSLLDKKAVKAIDSEGKEIEHPVTSSQTALFVYKCFQEEHVGEMLFFRVYSGRIQPGMELYNPNRNITERLGQLFFTNGRQREQTNEIGPGDLGVTVKLRNTRIGDTLCGPALNIRFPQVKFPEPSIHVAIKLKSRGEEDKLAQGLAVIQAEDPAFRYEVDPELRQTVISGQGELHLQVVADRIRERFRIDFDLVPPKIRFRETIKTKAEAKYRHKKQTGGAGQFAEVWLRIEPLPRGSGVEFTQSLVGQNVDRAFVPSVEKGVNAACSEGILAGYRIVDVKVDFFDGKQHPVDSNDISFQIAGREAFREAFLKANPCLLEPIHLVTVKVPEDATGAVIGDLSARRGKILGMDTAEGGYQIIRAYVPAMELYQYSTVLRSLTGGRAVHTEQFDHYEEMPKELEQKVIAEAKRAKEEEKENK